MKAISKILVLAVALVVIAAQSFAALQSTPTTLAKLKNVGAGDSQPGVADTASFTVPICAAGASGAMASVDTLESFVIPPLAYQINNNSAASPVTVNVFRLTAWGVPFLVTSDTLKAFVDFGNSRSGPWLLANPTTYVNLIVAAGAGVADTTGSGYYKLNLTPLTTLSNGGLTAFSGYYNIKPDATSPSNALGWKYARIRLAGDCTAPVYVTKFEVAVPTDVMPGIRN